MNLLRWLGVLLVAMAAATVVFPRQLGVSMVTGFAQLISFKLPLALGLLVLGVLVLLSSLRSRVRAARRPSKSTGPRKALSDVGPPVSGFRTGVAAVLVLAALIQFGIVWSRGIGAQTRPSLAQLAAQPPAKGEVTVLSVNTEWDESPPEEIADLAKASHALVIALPESERAHAEQVRQRLADRGMAGWEVFAQSSPWPNALLISPALGRYRAAQSDVSGLVVATPVQGTGPTVMTVHARPPARLFPLVSWSTQQRSMQQWRESTTRITAAIASQPWVIAAGDFNSTPDHASFINDDRYQWQGQAGGVGTWPQFVPAIASARIDHVVSDVEHWKVVGQWVMDVSRTDHRAVIARLASTGR